LRPTSQTDRSAVDFARSLEVKALSEAARFNLRVLIWGPTPNASGDQAEYATKRRQIKEALKAEGHEAYFSEDLVRPGTSIPTNLLELLRTEEMHAVIDLATDFGPSGEAHEFGDILREKLLLWLPFAARKKFIDQGMRRYVDAAGGRSVFFKDDHMKTCCIALASVDFVNDKRYLQVAVEKRIELLQPAAPIKSRRL
jgi:hypothetical protein